MLFLDNLNYDNMTKIISFLGMTDEFFCVFISMLSKKTNRNIVVVTPTLFEANKLVNCLNNYENNALLFPMDDFLTNASIATSPELKITRLETINEIIKSKIKIRLILIKRISLNNRFSIIKYFIILYRIFY